MAPPAQPMSGQVFVEFHVMATRLAGLDNPTDRLHYLHDVRLFNGNGAGQANVMLHRNDTMAAFQTNIFDLNAGSEDDAFGIPIVLSSVALVWLQVRDTAGDKFVGIQPSAPSPLLMWFGAAAHSEEVYGGGGMLLKFNPTTSWPVAGGADSFEIVNGNVRAESIEYDLVVLGRT